MSHLGHFGQNFAFLKSFEVEKGKQIDILEIKILITFSRKQKHDRHFTKF